MTLPSVELGTVASVERKSVKPDEIGSHLSYVGLENITADGTFVEVAPAGEADIKSNKFAFSSGHILYGKLRPYLSKIAAPQFGGVCSTDIVPISPGPDIDRRFLLHVLRTPAMVGHATRLAVGANLPRLSPKSLETFPIPLPPLEEQRRIAAVLDAADELRAKRCEVLGKLDTLTQAIFIDMFGDPVTNPRGWSTAPLAELGTLDRGVSKLRPRNDPALLGGPWPLIQTGDVASSGGYIRAAGGSYSDLGLAQSRMWPAGTLCITIAANIAKTGILTFDACFPDSVVGFTSDPATTEFVRSFLGFLQPVLEANAPESAQKNINLKTLRTADVPVPPSALRKQFAEAVDGVRAQHARLTASGDSFDELFASLKQRAFRGEL